MGVFGTVVNVHVVDDLATQTVFGKHTFHHTVEQGVFAGFEVFVEALFHEHFGGQFFLAAGITGEGVIDVVGHLFAGENNFVGINDDNVVATFNVGRVAGLVLAHENFGNFGAKATEVKAGSVDHIPFVVDALGIGREGSVAK